jgi:hypothetical protein
LRPYLTALPDFENIEAEDRSRSHALAFPDALTALHFSLDWPDLASAAALFKNRIDALDGNHSKSSRLQLKPCATANHWHPFFCGVR